MRQQNVRDRLIDNTIITIASNGLDKTTTKSIVEGTGINEAYIYNHFLGKEDLLIKAFDQLDQDLIAKLMWHLPIMSAREFDFETRCRLFFSSIWDFLIGNREKCLAFVRYYYSPYFVTYSAETHRKRYIPLVEKLKDAFIEEADVWMILNHILNVMLDFAVKVHHAQMPNEDNYTEHVFRVVYHSVKQYFKEEVKNNG